MSSHKNILAVESVGKGISVCFGCPGKTPLYTEVLDGFSAKHHLLSIIKDITNKHGPADALACAVGPGSFTGLRISCVAIRSLAWAWRLPVYCIDTMEALTLSQKPGHYICLMPLKKDTTFVSAYERDEKQINTLFETTAILDESIPDLKHLHNCTIIGPALADKPDLINEWGLDNTIGSSKSLDAETVLHACQDQTPQAWDAVLPAYHQASAPELQRAQK